MARPESIHKQVQAARSLTRRILEQISSGIVGKEEPVRLALTCLVARGRLRQIQHVCEQVHVSEALVDYVQALVNATRDVGWLRSVPIP